MRLHWYEVDESTTQSFLQIDFKLPAHSCFDTSVHILFTAVPCSQQSCQIFFLQPIINSLCYLSCIINLFPFGFFGVKGNIYSLSRSLTMLWFSLISTCAVFINVCFRHYIFFISMHPLNSMQVIPFSLNWLRDLLLVIIFWYFQTYDERK